MRKDFLINGASVLAIEEQKNKIVFLKVTPDDECMMEVTYTEFMDYFKSLAHLCIVSWNTALVEQYREFYKSVNEAIERMAESYA